MTFYVDPSPTGNEVSDALNYLLSNFGANVISDPSTGIITSNGSIIGYMYKFIYIKYADDFTGATNFSNSPTGRQYYGIRNANDSVESTNPADYIWHQVTGGFGTTKFIYYYPGGGRQCNFIASTSPPPSDLWILDPGTSIDLDVLPASVIQYTTTQFIPATVFITRTGSPLTPVFTGVAPKLYMNNKGVTVNFVTSQNDSDSAFVNNTWRIGGSSTTGNADIVGTGITIGSPTGATTYALFPAPTAMSSSPALLSVPVRYKTASGFISQLTVAVQQFSFVDVGSNSTTAYLYQWNSTTPGNPNGTSTFTWATNLNTGYTGTNGWSTSLPSNPGTPGLQLWIASQQVVAPTTDVTTTVSWTSGYTVTANTASNASKTATATVYQWAATIPTVSGSSTYTWSSASFSAPSGWATTITSSPSSGLTLWTANVQLVDATSVLTTTINWATASILSSGYSGANGASSRLTYARVPSNPAPVGGNITTAGNSTYPSGAQSLATWGFTATWVASDPNPSSTDSLYQSDGIYDSGTGNTIWGTPYISSLKVGSLSAITVNTGALTVNGAQTMSSTGYILGGQSAYNTGTGFFLGYSGGQYKFSLGNPAGNNLTWDGSTLSLNASVPAANVTGLASVATTGVALNVNGGGTFTGALSAATGSFAGSLSAATGSFAGSLSAATGSFNGTLSVGTSPTISGNSMTGTGALINSGGTFAIGTSANNIVNNGSGVFINGFTKILFANSYTGLIYSGVAISTYTNTYTTPSYTTTSGQIYSSTAGYINLICNFAANRRIRVVETISVQRTGFGGIDLVRKYSDYSVFSGGPYTQYIPLGITANLDASLSIGPLTTSTYSYTISIVQGNSDIGTFAELTRIDQELYFSIREINV